MCQEELVYKTGNKINTFLAITVTFPVIVIICFSMCLQNSHKKIEGTLFKQSQTYSYAAFLVTALYTSLYILAMDCLALYYASHGHEFSDLKNVNDSFNLNVTKATLSFDIIFQVFSILPSITIWLFLKFCKTKCSNSETKYRAEQCGGDNDVSENSLNNEDNQESDGKNYSGNSFFNILILPLCLMLGCNKIKTLSEAESSHNTKMWSLFFIFYGTIFCVSSHTGYILVAWLTEPDKATWTVLVMIAILLFTFLMLRKIYSIISNRCECCIDCNNKCHSCGTDYTTISGNNIEGDKSAASNSGDHSINEFNCCYFISTLILGLVLVVCPVIAAFVAFLRLPIPVLELADYIENITQIVFVLAAVLVSYKVLQINESDVSRFLKELINAFRTKKDRPDYNGDDEYKESGKIVGEVFSVVVK